MITIGRILLEMHFALAVYIALNEFQNLSNLSRTDPHKSDLSELLHQCDYRPVLDSVVPYLTIGVLASSLFKPSSLWRKLTPNRISWLPSKTMLSKFVRLLAMIAPPSQPRLFPRINNHFRLEWCLANTDASSSP